MSYREQLVKLLSESIKVPDAEVRNLLAVPPDSKMGDYAFPCFKLGRNPKEAAENLQKSLSLPKFILKTQVAGPYLNFYLAPAIVAEDTLTLIQKQKDKYGHSKNKKNIVVEYCGPNTNKPLHLGHVRNMALGSAVTNISSFAGNNVHPVNIINDRGVHICKSMLAYERWGNNQRPNKKGDHFVGDFYVLFAQKAAEDPTLEQQAQDVLVKWEQGDLKTRALWKKMNSWVLKGFAETYKRFGVKFEKEYFESDLYTHGKELVQEGLKNGIFLHDEKGSIIAPLEPFGFTNKVLIRADGTSVYITQDMYLAQLRFEDYHYDKMIYIVASEQKQHFQQLFKILEILKKPYAPNLYHLSYGMVNLTTGKMKSREGTVIDADDLMDEITGLAEQEIRSRYPNLEEKEIQSRAECIGLAAIKFYLLKVDAMKDITFDPKESLSFEGETGPYLQYTHARACSILRKAPKMTGKINYDLLPNPLEQKLLKLLLSFPVKVQETAQQLSPHITCHYLLDLAQTFNEYYHAFPVISEDKELMKARLSLVKGAQQVLHNGLELLGITALEEM